ncbi:hypothetical protein [Pseudomonas sp. FEN]|uniref:hypothetical protein n=1 Tax=Pseudomonas sp. FEN TaxID=2767468 RepID=UPI00398FB62C
MNGNTLVGLPWTAITVQAGDVRELPESERDALIITATQVDGQWIIISRYGDDIWQLNGFTSNVPANQRRLDFGRVPPAFRAVTKAMLYRYLRRGRLESGRPKGAMVRSTFSNAMPFLRHLRALKLDHLGVVTPLICATYVAACKAHRQTNRSKGKPLSPRGLEARFSAVEALHELSQYTDDRMPQHPWPETSAKTMAGLNGRSTQGGKTQLIPMMCSASCSNGPTNRLSADSNCLTCAMHWMLLRRRERGYQTLPSVRPRTATWTPLAGRAVSGHSTQH